MKKQTIIMSTAILLGTILLGNIVIAPLLFTVLIPTIGKSAYGEFTVTWQNGTEVTLINWGPVDNNTETSLPQLINITNTGYKPLTFSLNATTLVNITALTLTWNYTNTVVEPSNSVLVLLTQNVTFTSDSFGYTTKIDATG